jgi:transmembrane sensor
MANNSPKAREEASRWLAKLERGLRAEEGLALRDWLKDAANSTCILEMAKVWHGPEAVAVLSKIFQRRLQLVRPRPRRSLPSVAASAAATVAVVAVAVSMLNGRTPLSYFGGARASASPGFIRMYATAIGETRNVTLVDGSAITLNSGTRVIAMYGPRWRIVSLPYGEATFRVAHNAQLPFTVQAGTCLFEAAGTSFDVRVLTPDSVELTVSEGNVRVLHEPELSADAPAAARLDQETADDDTVGPLQVAKLEAGVRTVHKLEEVDVKERLAWQQGLIFFRNTPLVDAIAEIDRYTTARLLVADDRLRNIRIDGRFRTGDIDSVLVALRKDFKIETRRDDQGNIALTLSGAATT